MADETVEMVKKSENAETSTAFGRSIESYDKGISKVPYTFEWEEFKTTADIRKVNAWPSDAKILKLVNGQAKNKARTNAMNAAVRSHGITPPNEENDPQIRLRNMFNTLMSNTVNGVKTFTEETARATAAQVLGIAWDEDED